MPAAIQFRNVVAEARNGDASARGLLLLPRINEPLHADQVGWDLGSIHEGLVPKEPELFHLEIRVQDHRISLSHLGQQATRLPEHPN